MDTLYHLAEKLAVGIAPAEQQAVINNIPADMMVSHNCDWVASVIGKLLTTVLIQGHDHYIQLSAKQYGYIFVFEVQKSGGFQTESMKANLLQLQAMAEKIGGCITISTMPANKGSIAFSFPNLPLAA